jgi:hypothetical protein
MDVDLIGLKRSEKGMQVKMKFICEHPHFDWMENFQIKSPRKNKYNQY